MLRCCIHTMGDSAHCGRALWGISDSAVRKEEGGRTYSWGDRKERNCSNVGVRMRLAWSTGWDHWSRVSLKTKLWVCTQNGTLFAFRGTRRGGCEPSPTLPQATWPTRYIKRTLGAWEAMITATLLGHPPQPLSPPPQILTVVPMSEEDFGNGWPSRFTQPSHDKCNYCMVNISVGILFRESN